MKNVYNVMRLICLASSMYGALSLGCDKNTFLKEVSDACVSPKDNSLYAQCLVHQLQQERLAKYPQLQPLVTRMYQRLAKIRWKDAAGFKHSAKRKLDFDAIALRNDKENKRPFFAEMAPPEALKQTLQELPLCTEE